MGDGEEYIDEYYQESLDYGLRAGDIVICTRSARDEERGWPNSWVPNMDKLIGKECTIGYITEMGEVIIEELATYAFPFFVFEKIPKCTKPRD